jgi:hypothetical protein
MPATLSPPITSTRFIRFNAIRAATLATGVFSNTRTTSRVMMSSTCPPCDLKYSSNNLGSSIPLVQRAALIKFDLTIRGATGNLIDADQRSCIPHWKSVGARNAPLKEAAIRLHYEQQRHSHDDTTVLSQWLPFIGDISFAIAAPLMAFDIISKLGPMYPALCPWCPPQCASLWRQEVSELLEQFSVAGEVPRRILLLHLKHCARPLEPLRDRLRLAGSRCSGDLGGCADEKILGLKRLLAHSILRSSGNNCASTTPASVGILVCSASI